jgi:hypothetical protein
MTQTGEEAKIVQLEVENDLLQKILLVRKELIGAR